MWRPNFLRFLVICNTKELFRNSSELIRARQLGIFLSSLRFLFPLFLDSWALFRMLWRSCWFLAILLGAICDGRDLRGSFRFSKLPFGKYYIFWQAFAILFFFRILSNIHCIYFRQFIRISVWLLFITKTSLITLKLKNMSASWRIDGIFSMIS